MSRYQITTGFRPDASVRVGMVGLLCVDCAPRGLGGAVVYQGDDPLDLAQLDAAVEAHNRHAHAAVEDEYGAAGVTYRPIRPLFGEEPSRG